MKFKAPFNLKIEPIKRNGDTRELLAGIKQLILGSDAFYAEYKKRTLRASKEIAPGDSPGGIADSLRIVENGNGFSLDTSTLLSGLAYFDANYGDIADEIGDYNEFSMGGGSARAAVQEYGYPFRNGPWGPYPPNPNSSKRMLRGLGYKRVAFIVAARSMDKNRLNYGLALNASNVTNYVEQTNQALYRSYQNIIDNYLSGGKIPKYMKRAIGEIKSPTVLRAGVSKFTFEASYNLPMNAFTGSRPTWSSPANQRYSGLGNNYFSSTFKSIGQASFSNLVDWGAIII